MFSDLFSAPALVALMGVVALRQPERPREAELGIMESWLENFSPDAYLPMLRLAQSFDPDYVARQGGPIQARSYRRLQRHILREYLRSLSRDFEKLHSLATQSDSTLALVDEKMQFIFCMWNAEFRLFFSNLLDCRIDVQPLVANIAELTARTRELTRRRSAYRVS